MRPARDAGREACCLTCIVLAERLGCPHETAECSTEAQALRGGGCACNRFRRAANLRRLYGWRTQAKIFGEFEATLTGFDFTPGSFGVLTLVRANPGITQVVLAAAFGVDKSTMSPVVVRLEQRGLLRREVLASDRRCHALYFERSAEASYLAAREKVRAFEAGLASRLNKGEQRELGRLLRKLQGES